MQVDALLSIIEVAQQEFALEALRKMPEGPFAANYHHGVIVGMESVKVNILNKLNEEDTQRDKLADKRELNKPSSLIGGSSAYR